MPWWALAVASPQRLSVSRTQDQPDKKMKLYIYFLIFESEKLKCF